MKKDAKHSNATKTPNIATIALWISRFVFGSHEIGDGDTSSISKTPRIRSVKRTPKSKRPGNSAAGIGKYLALLIASGVDQKLMDLISTKSVDIGVQGAAARALSCLLQNEAVRVSVNLSGRQDFREVAQVPRLLPQLLDNLKACEADVLNTLAIIYEMSRNGEIREQLYTFGVIPAIAYTLSSGSICIQTKTLSILPPLLSSDDGIASFQQAGGVEKLVELLKSAHLEVRKDATATVSLLAHDKVAAGILYEAG
ncbi:Armadillo repeat-containing protein 3 [Taenia solium]|eukprot:TsM_001149900 transcript=TsM_001149900 gene=TsM_001149900